MAANQLFSWSLAFVVSLAQGTIMETETIYTTADCSGTPVATEPQLMPLDTCLAFGSTYFRSTCNATHKTEASYSDAACATETSASYTALGQCVNDTSYGEFPETYKTYQCTNFETAAYTGYGSDATCPTSQRSSMGTMRLPIGCRPSVSKENGALVLSSQRMTFSATTISITKFPSTIDCTGAENTSAAETFECEACHLPIDSESHIIVSDCATAAAAAAAAEGMINAARLSAGPWTLGVVVLAVSAGALATFFGAR